ncbi:MAG: arsenite/tail-anchored protein-transporting ATPase [Candidatus Methanomethylophilaceae archaeon]|nr:arsenite/tail-anchored protein-transporting ATPase [Candidatus Methanomethylophilaceae archaeon]
MRIIMYTGKGGVGKTSVSAATARRLAQKGYRTIIMSTDSAHSLGDSLGVELPPYVLNIEKNLDALEVDIIHEMNIKWSEISNYISAFMLSQGLDDITAEEMAVIPGMEMVAALFYVLQFKEEDSYDVVIMDTAPTGETLRLLSFPDISNWYIERMYLLLKRVVSIARVTVSRVIDFPLPSKEVMDSIEDIKVRMSKVKHLLEDPKVTTIRLVLNPERMVINETMRAYAYICLYNKTVECLIVNKVYPKEGMEDGYFKDRLAEQEKYMEEIHHAFDPLKMMYAYQMPTELRGPAGLDHMADMIFGDSDPSEIYAAESPMRFETADGMDHLIIKMPFVKKDKVELFKGRGDSLIIHVGSQKRTITLPLTLKNAEVAGAELKGGELTVKLKRQNADNGAR